MAVKNKVRVRYLYIIIIMYKKEIYYVMEIYII